MKNFEDGDFLEELRPGTAWLETEETQYWIDGGRLRWRRTL